MSLASTRALARLASAMASTPEPVPMSSAFRIGRVFGLALDGDEAAGGGAVVAGAEGLAGLDLDGDVVRLHLAAVVWPVHQEAAGAHRLQPFEALRHPVGLRQFGDDETAEAGKRRRARPVSGVSAK